MEHSAHCTNQRPPPTPHRVEPAIGVVALIIFYVGLRTKNTALLLAAAATGAAWLVLYVRALVEQRRWFRAMRKALGLTQRQRIWTIPRDEEPYRRWCDRRGLTPNPFAGVEGASRAHDTPSRDAPIPATPRREQRE
jgi:hypothetical protein